MPLSFYFLDNSASNIATPKWKQMEYNLCQSMACAPLFGVHAEDTISVSSIIPLNHSGKWFYFFTQFDMLDLRLFYFFWL